MIRSAASPPVHYWRGMRRCGDQLKPVLVSVYEMGRRRRGSGTGAPPPQRVMNRQSSDDHHSYRAHRIRAATPSAGGGGGGGVFYDRRAELLMFSQRLRAVARSDLRPASPPRPPQHSKHERKVMPIQVKREGRPRILACFRDRKMELPQANKEGNKWKLPQITGSFKTGSIARRLTVNRKRLVSKLVEAVRKQRSGVPCVCIGHH